MKEKNQKKTSNIDDKWKLLIRIFQGTFAIIIVILLYAMLQAIIAQMFQVGFIVFPIIFFLLWLEYQLYVAKTKNDIMYINPILRFMMKLLGALY